LGSKIVYSLNADATKMIASIQTDQKTFKVDLSRPLDISIPIREGEENVNAFYIPPVKFEPLVAGNFIGDVNKGGSCNVFSISMNPHGNGTHTETVGHISKEKYPVYKCLTQFFFEAKLITILPEEENGDKLITLNQLKNNLNGNCSEALIIRTLPNRVDKMNAHYSGTNPAYMEEKAAIYLRELNVKHLLLDLPSIDREEDNGLLLSHHAFWNYPDAPRIDCTISELVYVNELIKDGSYLLNLQIASFDSDASPSKPVLYSIHQQ
jgi:arylformamidase